MFFDENQIAETLPPNFDPDNVFPGDRLSETLKTKIYQALPLRFKPGSLDNPASPSDSEKTLVYSHPPSPVRQLESSSSCHDPGVNVSDFHEEGIAINAMAAPLVRLNATAFPLNYSTCDDSGIVVSDSDEEKSAFAFPLVRQNACSVSVSSCEQLGTITKIKRKVRL